MGARKLENYSYEDYLFDRLNYTRIMRGMSWFLGRDL